MKHLYVSVVALALICASFASPAFANGDASATTFTVSMQGFPDTISPGEHLTGVVSITLSGDVEGKRHRARFQIFVTTPLGEAPVQSGAFSIQPGTTRTFNVDIPVDSNAKPGLYTMKLVITMDGQTASVGHELTVR